MDAKVLGGLGEELAEGYLFADGYRLIERNYRCKFAEIDIMALKDGTLYAVEVKTRKGSAMGRAQEYITARKIENMLMAGQQYAKRIGYNNINIDAQLIEILINHIERV